MMVTQKLKEKGVFLFTPREFTRVFDVSLSASQWFIASYVKRGLFTKLRNGFYALSDAPRNHYLIANKLYQPSYISFETALSYHKLIPETIYAVTSAAPKATSRFTAAQPQPRAMVAHSLTKTMMTATKMRHPRPKRTHGPPAFRV